MNTFTPLKDWGFSDSPSCKEPACQCRRWKRHGLIPRLGRFPGGGQGNPFRCSCLENRMDRGAWWATGHESDTTEVTLACMHAQKG